MIQGPLAAYRAKLAAKELKPDPAQALAAEKLQSLHKALANYEPALGLTAWKARFGLGRYKNDHAPLGLYICGDVGRGKSMLMDLFYHTVGVEKKRRVHFHEFMREIHARIHAWRNMPGREDVDPMPKIARAIAGEAWLLCLDELEVRDITDAMIVGRLFQFLFENGVVVVTTSNRPPDDLYKNGLQRDKFLPFIAVIKDKLDILVLEASKDYRLGLIEGLRVFHHPLSEETERAVDECFAHLAGGAEPHTDTITVQSRTIPIPQTVHGVARFGFEDLCGKALGAGDYLMIATLYPTVFVTGIPTMGPENLDRARRFVILIDALYEHQVMLVCSAAAPPENLYPSGEGSFEFQRTVSRLMEMQSEEYLGLCHLT